MTKLGLIHWKKSSYSLNQENIQFKLRQQTQMDFDYYIQSDLYSVSLKIRTVLAMLNPLHNDDSRTASTNIGKY